jgi:hypothetical protein
MTDNAPSAEHRQESHAGRLSDSLTQVELTWYEKRIENWIRFGDHVEEKILDRRRRTLSFRGDTVFAFVRWLPTTLEPSVRASIYRARRRHAGILQHVTTNSPETSSQLPALPSPSPSGSNESRA